MHILVVIIPRKKFQKYVLYLFKLNDYINSFFLMQVKDPELCKKYLCKPFQQAHLKRQTCFKRDIQAIICRQIQKFKMIRFSKSQVDITQKSAPYSSVRLKLGSDLKNLDCLKYENYKKNEDKPI